MRAHEPFMIVFISLSLLASSALLLSNPDASEVQAQGATPTPTSRPSDPPDLYISKSKYSGSAAPGSDVQYGIYYSNVGYKKPAHDVRITDTLPALTTYISDTNSAGFTTVITGDTMVWTKPLVSTGESGELYLTVHISDTTSLGDLLTNTVRISTSDPEYFGNYDNNEYAYCLTLGSDLSIFKGRLPGDAGPGGVITYVLYYLNEGGGMARDVRITDTLPALTTYISDTNSADFTTAITEEIVVWTKPSVSGGEQGWFALTVRISDTASLDDLLTNTVRISTSDEEYEYNNNEYTSQLTLRPDLEINNKWKSSGEAEPGRNIEYGIGYHNAGGGAAHDVRITDTLPAWTTYVSSDSVPGFTRVITGNAVVWTKPLVPGGEWGWFFLTVHISATAPSGGLLLNIARISSSDRESDYSNNSHTDIQILPGGIYLLLIFKNYR
jgi:uncharacterized repeat protein (TIGR01451 family)